MYTVYIVEDEHLERQALTFIIKQQFTNLKIVGQAASGKVALDEIRKFEPDIVLMDINIPEMSGIEVLREIKKENINRKVILITAFNEFDFAHQAIKFHVDDFLLKPIRPKQLKEALNNVTQSMVSEEHMELEQQMSVVLYSIAQKKYSETRDTMAKYINSIYDYYHTDFKAIRKEINTFLDELHAVSIDTCNYEIMTTLRSTDQQNEYVFSDQYKLKVELMKVIDKIYDHIIVNHSDHKNTIDDILNYIDRNCYKDISLDQVGEYANMSSYYLSKIFKRETGVNFVTYLTERKIDIAKEMLIYTDIPIINIALELSYHEPNYFSKVFKKNTGMTPTEYRKHKK